MKVLVNVLSAVAGGAITYLRNIVVPLAARFEADGRHELHFLLHRSQLGLIPSVPASVKLRVIDGELPRSYARLWWERNHIPEYLRDIDVYFVPYQVGRGPANVRTVLMLRNMEPFFHWQYPYDFKTRARNEVLYRVMGPHLRRAQRVIAVSDFARDYLTNRIGVPQSKSVTVRHGGDAAFRAPPGTDDRATLAALGVGENYIFTSGSLLPYRRLEDIVAAFAANAPSHAGLQLVATGAPLNALYVGKINDAIARSGVAGRVVLAGNVPHQTMAILYRNARLFVTASEIEACPNTIIEALLSRSAIIAPRRPPYLEFIGDAGRYFDSRDVNGLATAMAEILDDETLRTRLKDAAWNAASGFTWERCADQTFDALTKW